MVVQHALARGTLTNDALTRVDVGHTRDRLLASRRRTHGMAVLIPAAVVRVPHAHAAVCDAK